MDRHICMKNRLFKIIGPSSNGVKLAFMVYILFLLPYTVHYRQDLRLSLLTRLLHHT